MTRKLINQKMCNNKFPLQYALEKRRPAKFVEKMLMLGADTDILDQDGASVLHLASKFGDYPLFELILNVFLEKCQIDYYQRSLDFEDDLRAKREELKKGAKPVPLSKNARFGGPRGVDLFLIDSFGKSALHYAAEGGNSDICARLIREGLDPRIESKGQRSAFSLASDDETAGAMAEALEENLENVDRMTALEPYHFVEAAKAEAEANLPRSSPSKRQIATEVRESARPWGGSKEAEEYRKEVRRSLRDLRADVAAQLDELRSEIERMRTELLPPEDGETEVSRISFESE